MSLLGAGTGMESLRLGSSSKRSCGCRNAEATPAAANRAQDEQPQPRLPYMNRQGAGPSPFPQQWRSPPPDPSLPVQQLHGYPASRSPVGAHQQSGYPPPTPAMGPSCPWPPTASTHWQHTSPTSPSQQSPPFRNGYSGTTHDTNSSSSSHAPEASARAEDHQPQASGAVMHAESMQHPRSHLTLGPDSHGGPSVPTASTPPSGSSPNPVHASHSPPDPSTSAASQQDPSPSSPAGPAHQQSAPTNGSEGSRTDQDLAAAQGWPLHTPGEPQAPSHSLAAGQWRDRLQPSDGAQQRVGAAGYYATHAPRPGYASMGYVAPPPSSLWVDNGQGYLWNQQTGQWATLSPSPPLQAPAN